MSLYNMMSTGTSFDSWLTTDSESERYAAAEDRIDERVKELCNHDSDYDHTLFENFSEDIYSATIEEANSIEEYLLGLSDYLVEGLLSIGYEVVSSRLPG